jgi:hypothetical protein
MYGPAVDDLKQLCLDTLLLIKPAASLFILKLD